MTDSTTPAPEVVAARYLAGEGSKPIAASLGISQRQVKSILVKAGVALRHVRGRPPRHGHAGTPEYFAWKGIIRRCTGQKYKGYENYGGREITVCARWLDSFENFLADVGPRPSAKHTIDRIDNDGNYEPGNVRWATQAENNVNRRSTRRLTYQGETLLLREWCERLKVDYRTIIYRLLNGWSTERALGTPVNKNLARP